mgnify:CR=1 FL=1
MKLMKRLKIFLALFLAINTPLMAIAQDNAGRYIQLEEGSQIPWRGWCFDEVAIAKILAEKETQEQKCLLKTGKAIERQKAKYDLQIGKLQAKMNYEINTRQASVDALSEENRKLEKTIINNSKYGWITPLAAGVLAGLLLGIAL